MVLNLILVIFIYMDLKYNPDIYHRRSIRLKNYDYSQCGAYYITICTKNRECYFEKYLTLKNIVANQWENIPNRYPHVELDEYIIMPDHFHGIISIVGAGARPAPTIGKIIGSFKSLCIVEWLKYISKNNINESGKFWLK